MTDAPYLWLGKPGQEVLRQGLARELAEQAATTAHDDLVAPACPACGTPVRDRDYEHHKRFDHDVKDDVLPYGHANSREVFVAGFGREDLEAKKAAWHTKHPGLRLALAGEGSRAEGRIVWQRLRVLGTDGKPVR